MKILVYSWILLKGNFKYIFIRQDIQLCSGIRIYREDVTLHCIHKFILHVKGAKYFSYIYVQNMKFF